MLIRFFPLLFAFPLLVFLPACSASAGKSDDSNRDTVMDHPSAPPVPGFESVAEDLDPIEKSPEAWREILTPEQFRILREEGTERAGTSPLNEETREGVYRCAGCGLALFHSRQKFDSRTGWPSFTAPLHAQHIGDKVDRSFLMRRIEVHCVRCGGHLGHVFEDGPEPTGLRYCLNGLALTFDPTDPQD